MTDIVFYKAYVTFITAVEVSACALYFRSVWVSEGYKGLNGILELFEVRTYYLHVMGFLFLFVATGMIFTPPITHYDFPWEAWTFIGSVFAAVFGSEVTIDFKRAIKKMKGTGDASPQPNTETDETTK